MWQRFTERARKVVFLAQEEAQRFGEGYVSTEHMLLGLVKEDDSTAARVIEKLGVSLNLIRGEVEKQLPRGDARPSQDMTLTPRAKRVIDLAYDEARNIGNNWIGTEHLLLGLIREGDGLAGRVLAKVGVGLDAARREVLLFQGQEPRPEALKPESATISYPRLASKLGSLFQTLLKQSVTEGKEANYEAAARLPLESGIALGAPYLVLMALGSPSDWLQAVFEEMGVKVEDAANALLAAFVNFPEQAPTVAIPLENLLVEAQEQMAATNKSKLGDEHLVLAALALDVPLVGTTFRAIGITVAKMREAIKNLEEGEMQDEE